MKRTKRSLLIIVLFFCLLTAPLINTLTLKRDSGPLAGVTNDYAFPRWTRASYLDGTYQQTFDNSFTHGFSGIRTLTRLINELRYRVFRESNADTVVCKDGSIIYKQYIDEYLGLDELHHCSPAYIESLTAQLARLWKLAQEQGKAFAVVITPSKADYWVDRIPEKYFLMNRCYTQEERGARLLTAALAREGVPFVDGPAILSSQEYPFELFTETGIHFTQEAGLQVVEGLRSVLAEQGVVLKQIVSVGQETYNMPLHRFLNWEDDIWMMMNIFSTRETSYSYPIEEEILPDGYVTPAIFWQGGSFIYTVNDIFLDHDMVSDSNILFYADGLRDRTLSYHPIESLEDEIIRGAVAESDVILLEVNEEYVYNMGSGFLGVLEDMLREEAAPESAGRAE